MNATYTYTNELSSKIEALNNKMLCTINYEKHTVTFDERAINFFETLDVTFTRAANALVEIGEALDILTAEQIADFRARRAEFEKFVGDQYTANKAAGMNETAARAAAIEAWNNRPVETAAVAEIETTETETVGYTDDEKHYPILRATAEQLAKNEIQRQRLRAAAALRRREAMFQRSPRMRWAADLAAAIGQSEHEGMLYLAIEIVEAARHSHPQDAQARECYNELTAALALTRAPLLEVRAFMQRAAEGFGY